MRLAATQTPFQLVSGTVRHVRRLACARSNPKLLTLVLLRQCMLTYGLTTRTHDKSTSFTHDFDSSRAHGRFSHRRPPRRPASGSSDAPFARRADMPSPSLRVLSAVPSLRMGQQSSGCARLDVPLLPWLLTLTHLDTSVYTHILPLIQNAAGVASKSLDLHPSRRTGRWSPTPLQISADLLHRQLPALRTILSKSW